MRPTVLVYAERHPERTVGWLERRGVEATLIPADASSEGPWPEVDVVLGWAAPQRVIDGCPHLSWIQVTGAGVDHMARLTLPEGVIVTRMTRAFGAPIAEYVMAELLYDARGIERLRAQQRACTWDPFPYEGLSGKVLGIAGLGSIGGALGRRAKAFRMTVYGLSRRKKEAPWLDRHFTADAWLDFVSELDVLTLVLPLTAETRGVVDARVLAAMKPEATLVNVGRGPVVREADLIDALKRGCLRRAVLDVFEQEPLPEDSPLWTMPQVTVSPHMSGRSEPENVGPYFLENLERYRGGAPLEGEVDLSRGY